MTTIYRVTDTITSETGKFLRDATPSEVAVDWVARRAAALAKNPTIVEDASIVRSSNTVVSTWDVATQAEAEQLVADLLSGKYAGVADPAQYDAFKAANGIKTTQPTITQIVV